MNQLSKVLESQTQVRFQHCDPFNHLNNANYIDYFMNHREDVLTKHYELNIYNLLKSTNKSWVSTTNQIAYLKPAHLMETVTIESQLIAFSNSFLRAEMRMYNNDKTELKSVLWASFTYIDLITKGKAKHSDILLDLFNTVHNPVTATNFEDRIKALRLKTVA